MRYTASGALDSTFGTGGAVVTDIASYQTGVLAILVQGDGKILVTGRASDNFVGIGVARYNTDGTLDTSFNATGTLHTFFGSTYAEPAGIAIQSEGRILICGTSIVASRETLIVGALSPTGQIDSSFGTAGVATASFGAMAEVCRAMVIQSDDKPVVVGNSNTNGVDTVPVIARFTAQGSLDTTFNSTGTAVLNVPNTTSGEANAVAIDPMGRFVVAGLVKPTSGSNGFTRLFVTRVFP
jgi:uncharacterized delta-60 repeat protein